jgi:molybdopterin converting factor small subunit
MIITISFPGVLREGPGGPTKVKMNASTVREAISHMETQYGGVENRLFDKDGKLQGHLNIYRNGKDIRFLNDLETPLDDGDDLTIFAAVGGG